MIYFAGGVVGDFVPLTIDDFSTLDGTNRRACVDVRINPDNIYEGTESFSISLEFDEFVPQEVRDQVTIEPSVVNVDILEDDRKFGVYKICIDQYNYVQT